ncbi:ATP-binding protein [Marinitenerispora sediminis]|uniref:ATP-binding protein n=1 Tax=Marinitenerispora sediminis TaxID=1931232 RepID=UPI0035A94063
MRWSGWRTCWRGCSAWPPQRAAPRAWPPAPSPRATRRRRRCATWARSSSSASTPGRPPGCGPGLAEAELAHATRRFWRSATAGQRGTGLGLAILQQLVAGRGGTLRLRRGAPRGMVVEIGLPAPEGGAPRVPAAEGPGPGGAR